MATKKTTKTLDLATIRTIATQAVADKDSQDTTASARAQSLREAILIAFPKAKTMTADDDALKPIRDAYVQAAAIAWCGKVRTSKDGSVTYPTDKVLATYSMAKKVRDAQPETVREGRKVAQGAARKFWFDDIRRAFPEWVKREETAKAVKASAPKAEAEGEAAPEGAVLSEAEVLSAIQNLAATMPKEEFVAFAHRLADKVGGIMKLVNKGSKVPRAA